MPEYVVLEQDILWRPEFATPDDDYRAYRNLWLRVAKNIGQCVRPVVLAGTSLPHQYESCPEQRYFTTIHYLALVCDDDILEERLRSRPQWRRSGSAEFVGEMVRFNRWLKENFSTTQPPMSLLDTSSITIEESSLRTMAWIDSASNTNNQGQSMLPHPANMFASSHAAGTPLARLYLAVVSRKLLPDHRRTQSLWPSQPIPPRRAIEHFSGASVMPYASDAASRIDNRSSINKEDARCPS